MNSHLSEFYSNKKIIITGNTGFKGVWLSLSLSHLGAKLYGYSNEKFNENPFCKFVLKQTQTTQKYGNITDKNKLENFIKEIQPDIIFHLAAQPLVSESYINPYETINTNVVGLLNVLEILRTLDNKCNLVAITSDKCYKINPNLSFYNENNDLGGFDPYSMSKAIQEHLVATYNNNYFNSPNSLIKCCTIRSGNVIGGGDFSSSRLIPDLVTAITNKSPITLRNPKATRPWIYVMDTILAYIIAGEALSWKKNMTGNSYNVGPEKSELYTVHDLVYSFVRNFSDSKIDIIDSSISSFKESDYLFLDTLKIKNELKWESKQTIKKAIEETANWYKRYHINQQEAFDYSVKIVTDYFSS